MATEKQIKARQQQKTDTPANWDAAGAKGFIPKKGEIIVYQEETDDKLCSKIKIGDGVTTVNALEFINSGGTVQPTPDGGIVLGDETSEATGKNSVVMGTGSTASGKNSVAMGEEVIAAGDGSFAQGGKVFRSEAESVTNAEGKYYAVLDGEYALAHPENCVDVATYPETEPPIVQTSDGMFCYLHDVRYAEAHGYASMTAGQGAVAYSRASKSLGYRTQTGYVTSPELAEKRPEAITYLLNLHDFVPIIDGDSKDECVIWPDAFISEYHAWPVTFTRSISSISGIFTLSATCNPNDTMRIKISSIGSYSDDNYENILHDVTYYSKEEISINVEIPSYSKNLVLFMDGTDTYSLNDVKMVIYPKDNTGQSAFAIGADTVAAANQSFAGGWKSKALAHAAFAFGTNNEIRGDSSASFGNGNKVKGANSLAAGKSNIIELNNSIVAGANNTVGGNQSIVIGSNNVTSGKTTQAIFGIGNEADRIGQTVVGIYNIKDTNSLFVVGNGTDKDHKNNALTVGFSSTDIYNNLKAKKNIIGGEAEIGSSTDHSVVIGGVHPTTGKNTKATTQYNFVFGRGSQATKWGAMVLGDNNTSSGFNSLATGAGTEALKDNSATFGKGTKSGRNCQVVIGEYNEPSSDALLVVGTGSADDNRKNAFEVKTNEAVFNVEKVNIGNDVHLGLQNTTNEHGASLIKRDLGLGSIQLSSETGDYSVGEPYENASMKIDVFGSTAFSLFASSDWDSNISGKLKLNDIELSSNSSPSSTGSTLKFRNGNGVSLSSIHDEEVSSTTSKFELNRIKLESFGWPGEAYDVIEGEGFKLFNYWDTFYTERDAKLILEKVDGNALTSSTTISGNSIENTDLLDIISVNRINLKSPKIIIDNKLSVGAATATGHTSVAIGDVNTQANKQYNLSFGRGSITNQWGAMALGDSNTSSGYNSLATGANTEALNHNSATFGKGTKTSRAAQTVVGQWNDDDSNALFIVGSGSSDSNRKNAFVVNADGSVVISSNLTVNGQDIKSMIDNAITGAIGGSY